MTINFLGDSITEGVGASSQEKNYVNQVSKLAGFVVRNYGVGGTRIARQEGGEANWSEDFVKREEKMDKNADYVFVFGGTNDYGHGLAEIGEEDSENIYTFCGAFNVLIHNLIKKYGKEKIHFILPLKRYNMSNPRGDGNKIKDIGTLEDYVKIMIKILNKYGIKYMDLFHNGFPEPFTNGNSEFFADGLHPNDNGHYQLAKMIVEYIKKIELNKKSF